MNGCVNTAAQMVKVNVLPTVSITKTETSGTTNNDAIVCTGASVTLSGAGATSYLWDNGITNSTSFVPSSTITYTVTGTDVNGCVNTATQYVAVNALPIAGIITGSNEVCVGEPTQLNAGTIIGGSGSYSSTLWSTSIPSIGTINTTGLVTGVAGGITSITYTVTDSKGCISPLSAAYAVTVNLLPITGVITGTNEVCVGLTTPLSAGTITGGSGTISSTLWLSSASSKGTINSTGVVTGVSGGTISITYKVTDSKGCVSTLSAPYGVTINALPTVAITNPSAVCAPGTVDLTATAITAGSTLSTTYTYFTNAAATTTLTMPAVVATSGTYYIKSTSAANCIKVEPVDVTVNALPTVTITNPSAVCAPGTIDLTATAITSGSTASLTFTYFTNATATTSLTNASTISASGSYYIKGTNQTTSCFKIEPVVATINPLPVVTITNPSAICAPGTIDLTATAITSGSTASLTFTYFTNATATTTLTNTTLIGTSGTYYIKGTSTLNCSVTQPVITTINLVPGFNLLSPSVCTGSPLTINANPLTGVSTDYNYTWLVPAGVANPGNVSNFTTTTPGIYTATLKNKITNCESASINNTISFYPLPTASRIVASDNKVMEGATLNLTAAASGGTGTYLYSWIPNSTVNYTIIGDENALFNALKEGTVNIKYQVKDANNCLTQSANFEITIAPSLIIFEIPNAFTPNGDGMNDELKVISNVGVRSLSSFKIFSRSGNLVFESRNLSSGWDGRFNGNLLQADIYYWTAVYVDRNNVVNSKNGTVLLLK